MLFPAFPFSIVESIYKITKKRKYFERSSPPNYLCCFFWLFDIQTSAQVWYLKLRTNIKLPIIITNCLFISTANNVIPAFYKSYKFSKTIFNFFFAFILYPRNKNRHEVNIYWNRFDICNAGHGAGNEYPVIPGNCKNNLEFCFS